ncbi:hypothetical protein D4R71_04510 [bacterium]|nr:MAG: hypothetical protein D4R71_04510 [bacterium]
MKFKLPLFFFILVFYSFEGLFTSIVFMEYGNYFSIGRFLCDGILILLALSCFYRKGLSASKKFLLIFIMVSTFTYIYNQGTVTLVTHFNGLRDPLVFFSALVFINYIFNSKYKNRFIRSFSIYLIIFALTQLPTMLIQFYMYGAGDRVIGTAGGSGVITMLLFLICFYLCVKYASTENEEGYKIKKLLAISLLLVPCAFNETKISFILLPLYFLFLSIKPRKKIFSIPIILLGGFILYFLYYFYTRTAQDPRVYLSLDFVESYFFTYNVHEGTISRYAMIPEMFYVFSKDVGAYIFGIGYGIFKGEHILGISQVGESTAYLWSRSQILLFSAWMQGGICFVLVLFLSMFSFMKRGKGVIYSKNMKDFKYFLFFALLIMWSYNAAILTRIFAIIASYMMIWCKYGEINKKEITMKMKFNTD